jgi:glycosyltransferase involved in cell wall biosynthesis
LRSGRIIDLKDSQPTKEISILLPAFNEAVQIERCILEVETAVKAFSKSYEIIVSEDGSTDGTDIIVARMAKDNPNLFLLHSPKRLGKGKGIKNALSFSKGKIITFMDVDLATNLDCLPQLLQVVKENEAWQSGPGHIKGSVVQRRASEDLFSNLQHNS